MPKASMQAAVERFRRVADALTSNGNFKTVFEETPAFRESDLDDWEHEIRSEHGMEAFVIAPALRTFYGITGGFRFQWQFLPQAGTPSGARGSANIVDILDLYRTEGEAAQPFKAMFRSERPFDNITPGKFVGLKFAPPDASSYVLQYVEDGKPVGIIPATLDEYLDHLVAANALYGWRRAAWGVGPTGLEGSAIDEAHKLIADVLAAAPGGPVR